MILPIETEFGELHGRDTIFLDKEKYDRVRKILLLSGEINGNLCTVKKVAEFIQYEVIFRGVVNFNKIDLDVWLSMDKPLFHETSSFYQLEEFSEIKTFVFQTYDDVHQIECTNYEMIFRKE